MAPTRGSQGGQMHGLDEISVKIGELTTYVHEHRHGVNNLSAKFDALALDIVKRVEALDTKMTLRIDDVVKSLTSENAILASRVVALERERNKREGAVGVVAWFFENWLAIAAFFGMALLVLKATGRI